MSTFVASQHSPASNESLGHRANFRSDIQGLRAVAVLSVFIYHLNPSWLPGGFIGVDIFFVISGYLITGLLIRQLEISGYISIKDFYGRRAKRLLPAATLALVCTVLLTYLVLPASRWGPIGWDTLAATFYVENWRLALSSVDYLQMDQAASPLQHFWSLGVEEQFYFVWPFLLLLLGLIFANGPRRHRGPIKSKLFRPLAIVVLSSVAIASFFWSVSYTSSNPGPAYFVTTTRVWELALGAILAAASLYVARLSAPGRLILGWSGLVGIALALYLIDSTTPYPGSAALLPTLSTALVIACGVRKTTGGPGVLLGVKPAVAVGDISYSLYLWHWPVIVFVTAVVGSVDLVTACMAGAVSLLIAWVSYRFVERPINEAQALIRMPEKSISLAVVLMMISVIAGLMLITADRKNQSAAVVKSQGLARPAAGTGEQKRLLGAEVLPNPPSGASTSNRSDSISPDPLTASKDRPTCESTNVEDSEVSQCQFGVANGRRVALVGDSHAGQWIPALEEIATTEGWSVQAYLHDSCPFATGALLRSSQPYSSCIEWNSKVSALLASQTDLQMVITSNFTESGVVDNDSDGVSAMALAHAASWKEITERNIPLAVLRDTPAPRINVPECVSQHEDDLAACAVDRSKAVDDRGLAQVAAAALTPGATVIDLTDYICPAQSCGPVIGDVLVYRDSNHLTATYAQTLATALAGRLKTIAR